MFADDLPAAMRATETDNQPTPATDTGNRNRQPKPTPKPTPKSALQLVLFRFFFGVEGRYSSIHWHDNGVLLCGARTAVIGGELVASRFACVFRLLRWYFSLCCGGATRIPSVRSSHVELAPSAVSIL